MNLLEIIKKASSKAKIAPKLQQSRYPIVLNPNDVLLSLKPQSEQHPDANTLIEPVSGFKISQLDTDIIDLCLKFYDKLTRKLKNRSGFGSGEFIVFLNSFLENLRGKIGIPVGVDPFVNGYSCVLVEKVGFLMGRDVSGLVLQACIDLDVWDVLEAMIVNGIVEHSFYSNVIDGLAEKNKSDLICACIKQFSDISSSDILSILKYFLSPSKNGYASMVVVKKIWESQALLAIEKASDKSLKTKKLCVANDASILLMIAYDGFTVAELCLHYLIASVNLDEFVLTSALSKLNSLEMMSMVRYLGKWLKKYERFPQAGPCPKALSMFGLKACDWVPTVEAVVKCLGLVLDEHYSSLVLHPEFHEELRSINKLVGTFAMEGKFCCSITNVVKNLKSEVVEG